MVAVGDRLSGRYRVEAALGEGATATGWRAWDDERDEAVALKVVRAHATHEGDDGARARLLHELDRLRGLRHPRLVELLDVELHEGAPFLVTRLVEGTRFDAWASDVDDEARLAALGDVLEGLAFLHELRIRHGDVKPANVLVDGDGRATLIDLGCAAELGARRADISGTPAYMAPELLEGRGADARSDLYAVGVMMEALDAPPAWAASLTRADPLGRPSEAAEVLERLGRDHVLAPRGRSARLAGRDGIVRTVQSAFDALAMRRDGPRVIGLEGPDGVGRTRLLRELRWAAQRRVPAVAVERRGLGGALARLTGGAPPEGLDAALSAREALIVGVPRVLMVDDAHRLEGEDRAILEAFARLAAPTDALLLVVASRPGGVPAGEAVRTETLAPLERAELAAWAAGLVTDLEALERASGGLPRRVEAILGAVARGEIPETELERAAALDARDVDEDVAEALAALAVEGGWLPDARAVDERALLVLQARGVIRRGTGGWRAAVRIVGDPARTRPLHRARADTTEGPIRARHLALGGRADEARTMIVDRPAGAAPEAWARAVEALVAGAAQTEPDATPPDVSPTDALPTDVVGWRDTGIPRDGRLALAAALALADAGRAKEAGALAAAVLASRPNEALRAEARTVAGEAALRAGDAARAIRPLRRALAAGHAPARAPLARALVLRGDYAEAERVASEGTSEPRVLEARGIARVYLAAAGATEDLDAALAAAADAPPRRRFRLLSFRAIADFRAGDVEAAAARYEAALSIAEAHHLPDQLASAALNLGTARQQLGDWGAALRCYERAARLARALGRTSTAVTVEHNLANLYAGVGAKDRAEALRAKVADEARRRGLPYFEAAAASLRGELTGDAGAFEEARAGFVALDAAREIAEQDLHLAALARRAGRLDEARRRTAQTPDAEDLRARVAIERARIDALDGRAAEALAALEAARPAVARTGERQLEAELEAALAEVAEAAGATHLADTHRATARRIHERIALTLPEPLREGFLSTRGARVERPTSQTPTTDPSLARLLAVNARINSSLSTDAVLAHAIDAAIELTGAERGFILLDGDPLDVAIARNLDREKVGRSHLKFSHSIAARVLESGAPLLTTDARADARFASHESVHAMRLSSIVCVPIVAPRGVLGAIYLDNRFERGRFVEAHLDVLVACADQVAIALENARLVTALEERTAALEAERARVEELLREREATIERLERQVAATPSARADAFTSIVGTSTPMRELLAQVSRVLDAQISVVVEGESGTGKELVARAIHDHGPRADAPFVAVNCGALPDPLLEGELFGWVRGAFTGADRDRDGLFVRGDGGTVFLDEVGEMSPAMQTKLLRVLQEGEVTPLGSAAILSVDARVVAATNRDLAREVEAGRFREDLYYRLAVVRLAVPSLRARREDLPALAEHALRRRAAALGVDVPELHPDAVRALLRHDWPGNVRELENVLSRALVMGDGAVVRVDDLGLGDRRAAPRSRRDHAAREKEAILAALGDTRWNVSEVSRRLGIPRTTLYRKLQEYGIDRR